jgi:hypothetical protein
MPKSMGWVEKDGKTSQLKHSQNVTGKGFIIADEVSMIDKTMLYQASSIVGHFQAKDTPMLPFAGANVIFTGDFH